MASTPVAVAIPAYNAATTIGKTLDALQANPGLSRIALVALLDDCSKDRTAEVARAHWEVALVLLHIWSNPANMGQWPTTNAVIAKLANGAEWTFILHADDVVKPSWLSLYLDELPRIPRSVASICSSYDVWWPASGRIEPGEECPDRPAVHVAGDRASVLDTLEKGCWWHLSGCALQRSIQSDRRLQPEFALPERLGVAPALPREGLQCLVFAARDHALSPA